MSNPPTNPITAMRGEMTQEQFAFAINTRLGIMVVNADRISHLERVSYATRHTVQPDALAVFALYSGRPLAALYAEYQDWLNAASAE